MRSEVKGYKDRVFQSTHPHRVRLFGGRSFAEHRFVSIHAPTRGATLFIYSKLYIYVCFNPRTHTGCDDSGTVCVEQYSGFNPRTHTGCDKVPVYTDAQLFEFQSTHPHGVRLPTNNIVIQGFEFQSTHPHGVRHAKFSKGLVNL